ncbi:MAG: M48 family metallopeptidase [Paludisphaera borealis]|uniref:M48 family metallopeptidase n=1 Tax=Paludisphaera borealis TaxID=1387353 RepID=UPI0028470C7B|nr:M48 family metallopeptidase [Paludisphaera borealis]MDR3620358.1 M48 family metallopeptidase [Paludisphaera borealis]
MIPIPLLVALFLAFAVDGPSAPPPEGADLIEAVLWGVAGGLLISGLSFVVGLGTAWRVGRRGYATSRMRRDLVIGSRLLNIGTMAVFGWMIFDRGWPGIVLDAWGWRGSILVDDLLIIAPFLLMQLCYWWGTYYGERAIQGLSIARSGRATARHLYLKERQSLALILPIVSLFVIRNDVIGRLWPRWETNSWSEPVDLAVLGVGILLISPLFVRLAWPTRSLPDGPLRRRLETIARRSGFRFTDILVWDTDHLMVNACVTGVLPQFRYVLLSDALIDALSPLEIAAVFGHEAGHVAHRHLPFFLFFFVGCLTFLTLTSPVLNGLESWIATVPGLDLASLPTLRGVVEGVLALACVGVVFWLVFGEISRRFERQADVFGCKAVSCGLTDCPPHFDFEDDEPEAPSPPIQALCPAGIQIFSEALASVAHQNGIDATARSWRHGSIASRIAFLQKLIDAPEREVLFQNRIRRFRFGLSALLVASLAAAGAAHWLGLLG